MTMRVLQTRDRMVVRDRPGAMWFLGLMFVASGTLASAGALGLFENSGEMKLWVRLAVLGIGLAHLAGALHVLRSAPATELVLDRAAGQACLRTRGLRVRAYERFPLSALAHVEVREEKDSDGDPVFLLRLWLRGGRALRLHAVPAQGRRDLDETASALRAFLRLPAGGALA